MCAHCTRLSTQRAIAEADSVLRRDDEFKKRQKDVATAEEARGMHKPVHSPVAYLPAGPPACPPLHSHTNARALTHNHACTQNATQRNVRVPTEKLVQVQNTASATYATVAGICSAILDANRVEKRGTATMNVCIMAAGMPSWCERF